MPGGGRSNPTHLFPLRSGFERRPAPREIEMSGLQGGGTAPDGYASNDDTPCELTTPKPYHPGTQHGQTGAGMPTDAVRLAILVGRAQVAELADALGSGPSEGNLVGVRVPSWALGCKLPLVKTIEGTRRSDRRVLFFHSCCGRSPVGTQCVFRTLWSLL